MRALTLPQPFAQLVALGIKPFDVRTSGSDHRGRVAIHAARVPPRQTLLAECARSAEETGVIEPRSA